MGGARLSTLAVPNEVADALSRLTRAVGGSVILMGGWGVRCRLLLAEREVRATEDLDVLLPADLRPARAALTAIDAVQRDPAHPARLTGLSLVVDLLADDPGAAIALEPGTVRDADGLTLIVPPFADLLVAQVEHVVLVGTADTVGVSLPSAAALFANKVANLFLEHRQSEKWQTDAADALALLEAYGPSALAQQLRDAPAPRRARLAALLEQVGYGGLAAQARIANAPPYPDGRLAIPLLLELLR